MDFLTKTLLNTLALSGASLLLGIWILLLINIYETIKLAGDVVSSM
jgi:hypothetical protein